MSNDASGDINLPFDQVELAKHVQEQARAAEKTDRAMTSMEQTVKQYVMKKTNIDRLNAYLTNKNVGQAGAGLPPITPRPQQAMAGRSSNVGYLYNDPNQSGGTNDPLMQNALGPQTKGEMGGVVPQLSKFTSSLKEAVNGMSILKGAAITAGVALGVGAAMGKNASMGAQAGTAIGDLNVLGEQAFRHLGANPRDLTNLLGSSRKGADRAVSTAISMKTQRNMNVSSEKLYSAIQAINNGESPDDVVALMQAGNWSRISQYARKQTQWAPAQESIGQERVGNYGQWLSYNRTTSIDQRRRGASKAAMDFAYDNSAMGQGIGAVPFFGEGINQAIRGSANYFSGSDVYNEVQSQLPNGLPGPATGPRGPVPVRQGIDMTNGGRTVINLLQSIDTKLGQRSPSPKPGH